MAPLLSGLLVTALQHPMAPVCSVGLIMPLASSKMNSEFSICFFSNYGLV